MPAVAERWASGWSGGVAVGRRSRRVVFFALVTGVITGALVALFEWLVSSVLFEHLLEQPRWVKATAPLVGLLAAAALLRWVAGGATPATADEYIRNFHEQDTRLDERPVIGKLA